MYLRFGLLLALAAGLWSAPVPQNPEDSDVALARINIERVRGLVESGSAPRADLEKAELALEEAKESAFLHRTLYGSDPTEEQADEMLSVTQRRVERAKQALDKAQALVDQGVAARNSTTDLDERWNLARKEQEYAQARAGLIRELAAMARSEADLMANMERMAESGPHPVAERFDGSGVFTPVDLHKVTLAFENAFSKDFPVSALGETALHRALGFDHRNRVDVAVDPDQPEGVWLRKYLEKNRIPYFAFRAAVRGKATGPHIHIGPMSNHLISGG